MLNALGELINEAVQKQIAQSQQQRGFGNAPPGIPAAQPPPAAARAPQMGTAAPVRPAPVAKPPVAMGYIPDVPSYNSLPPLEPLDALAAPSAAPAFSNPLLDALRGGQALIGGIVVAQVLGPPAALRPHSAPTDTV